MLGKRSVPGLLNRDDFEALAGTVPQAVVERPRRPGRPRDDRDHGLHVRAQRPTPRAVSSPAVAWCGSPAKAAFGSPPARVTSSGTRCRCSTCRRSCRSTSCSTSAGTFVSMTHFEPGAALPADARRPADADLSVLPAHHDAVDQPPGLGQDRPEPGPGLAQRRADRDVAADAAGLAAGAADRQLRHHRGRRHHQLQRRPRDGRATRAHRRPAGAQHRGQDHRPRRRRAAAPASRARSSSAATRS